MSVTPELEAMINAIEGERWVIALEQVGGKTITSREGSERSARAALRAIRNPSNPAIEAMYAGEDEDAPFISAINAYVDHILGDTPK